MTNSKMKSNRSALVECLKKTVSEYICVSSITGLKYVQDSKANLPMKLFWLSIILLSFVFCNILVAHFWLRYKSNSTKMTIASHHVPLPMLNVPAITLCPIGRLDSMHTSVFVNNLNLPKNVSRDDVSKMFFQATGFFEKMDYNQTELEILQSIIQINRYSIAEAMSLTQQSCDDIFVRCRFEDAIVRCSDVFKPMLSYYGSCCTFNGNHEYNFSMSIQPKGILSAVLFPKLDASKTSNLYSEGIRLLIHESGSFASTFSFEKIISHRVETLVRLKSIKTTCHPQVSQGSIEARECLYETEKSLKYFSVYREVNCKLECLLARIENICNCLPYYYAFNKDIAVCNFEQIKCLVDNYWTFYGSRANRSTDCDCMSNCNDFSYDGVTSRMRLQLNNFSIDPFYKDVNSNHTIVHISFGQQAFTAMRKDPVTNILALAANLGGIYSLFIGFSALTFIEVVYCFGIRFYINYRKMEKFNKNFI